MLIPREERRVAANPTAVPGPSTSPGEIIGKGVENLGMAASRLVGTMQKERDELDTFETNMALQRFHGDQARRQLEYDNAPEGDGREHTARRLAEYDQASTAMLATLPNNERARKLAGQHIAQWREGFGAQSYRAQLNQTNTYREQDIHRFVTTNVVPNITGDRNTVTTAMAALDANLNGSNLPEANKERVRRQVIGLMVERFIEQGGSDARVQADSLISEHQQRSQTDPREPAPALDFRGRSNDTPAIRFNNPGAQYPGEVSRRWGATYTEIIGGGHQIAVFPDALSGAAAQMDLLASRYTGMSLEAAIRRWSGGNSSAEYVNGVIAKTGLTANTVLTPEMMRNPDVAIPLARAMADHEAGTSYPMSAEQWSQAHAMFMGGPGTVPPGTVPRERSDGLFVQSLIHNLDKIDRAVEKARTQEENAQFILDVLGGVRPFNGHDDVHRKRIDEFFKRQDLSDRMFAGDENALVYAVAVSHSLNHVPQRLAEALKGLIASTDENKRTIGYRYAASIVARNPHALSATQGGQELQRQVQEYSALVSDANMSPQEATQRIAEMQSPEWAKLEAERRTQADDPRNGIRSITEADLRSRFDESWLPFTDPNMPGNSRNAMLMHDFRNRVRESFIRYGDMELAKRVAAGELRRSWGISTITGSSTLTRYPPEKFYPEFNGSREYLQQDLRDSIATARGIDASKIDLGKVDVVADARTQREISNPRYGEPPTPSYEVLYRDENGVTQKILGRWRPDVEKAALNAERAAQTAGARERLGLRSGGPDRLDTSGPNVPPSANKIIEWLGRQRDTGRRATSDGVPGLGGR